MTSLRARRLLLSLLFVTFSLTEFEQRQPWAAGALLILALIIALPVITRRTLR